MPLYREEQLSCTSDGGNDPTTGARKYIAVDHHRLTYVRNLYRLGMMWLLSLDNYRLTNTLVLCCTVQSVTPYELQLSIYCCKNQG
jgi:hypothetical protein